MSLWTDKYRPLSFDKLTYHKEQAQQLQNLVREGDFPHLLFHGPSGAGKRTRVMCLLRELYGPGVEKVKIQNKTFTVGKSTTKVEVNVESSSYHIEINPSDCGNKDQHVIQALLKEIASTQQIDSNSQRSYKVVVIHETDALSKIAQQALRRTMEKYMSSCRLILLCNSSSQVLGPVRSRCLHIRVPAPNHDEIKASLLEVCRGENIDANDRLFDRIITGSNRNLRKALLTLEACKVQRYPFADDQQITKPDWEIYLHDTAVKVIQEQTPQSLLAVRGRLYELLIHCIPPSIILKGLSDEFISNIDDTLKIDVVKWAAHYEHRVKSGTKEIYHLEAFVAKFMTIYKKFLMEFAM